MSQREVDQVQHVRIDRRQHQRGALADDEYFVSLFDSFTHDENDSDLEDCESNPDEPELIENENESSQNQEQDENIPGNSVEKRRKGNFQTLQEMRVNGMNKIIIKGPVRIEEE